MAIVKPHSFFSDFDIALFLNGKHTRLYEKLGAFEIELEGEIGTYFSVWAPNAESVFVVGNFNFWDSTAHGLYPRWDSSGIWEGFIPQVKTGETYKYWIKSKTGEILEKLDPMGLFCETPPKTASIVWNTYKEWNDQTWMQERSQKNSLHAPMSIYEVHLGSWQKTLDNEYLSYADLSDKLVQYVKEMGFTHVEFMPVMEHPYAPSWGYQITGYFAPSSRFGNPQGFMTLVERFHQEGIGVILDWVPSHFPGDEHGLRNFDGGCLYEHPDPKRGFHPDWQSYIFDYGKNEVRSFLMSNAAFWLDRYHIDGLRVDAVASMLYLDYSRNDGEWEANVYGGNHNLEAISFLQELNIHMYGEFPDIQMIAEESTSFPGVTKPVFQGGLGFGQKWMMGWMNDTLNFFHKDPIHRKYHLNDLTFSLIYAFTENFCLPLSHDEVVYGKNSLLNKMPGDEWQKFANLRVLLSEQFTHPGSKLLFMGGEFGQKEEWNHNQSLDWHELENHYHKGIQSTVKALNQLYREEAALYSKQFSHEGFEWIESNDQGNSVITYIRKGEIAKQQVIVILNLTPAPRENYRIGVPLPGIWKVLFNSDKSEFGGSDYPISGAVMTEAINWQGKAFSISLNLPPMSALILKA
ncbi:1,4-alpha-glucan branching protein GlgB [Cytophagaceae bacterium 50C-KIRBA]|uniref:1,4-alpha-glucan branching enzyme GlgB n=1 Tax=Aquirufa beregesia TaxID=2516556 RepID=A0ABX0EUD6_9BACT|nr:1,4-alpha-glucan branching protein GlgB [Aquirufa beregesia]NGZ43385.1 1,4-alpha-glucan branching protein GlgB [Aquirufa beregesia]